MCNWRNWTDWGASGGQVMPGMADGLTHQLGKPLSPRPRTRGIKIPQVYQAGLAVGALDKHTPEHTINLAVSEWPSLVLNSSTVTDALPSLDSVRQRHVRRRNLFQWTNLAGSCLNLLPSTRAKSFSSPRRRVS
ncbi:hypothetical protein RRG08_042403 [Elysia crispata]|uniref:Uncharacterized protein n=1 Tax=Elysia crispata TaxID=231223 RepID=A0AAE0ZBX0_9GAST|nr:hypothetical protein RRG08_042403 [Elysia crispata]